MRLIASLLLVASITAVQARDPYPRHPQTDIIHYVFHLRLDTLSPAIQGSAEVTFRYSRQEPRLFLDLVAKDENKGMTVDGVTLDQQSLKYQHLANQLIIDCPVIRQADTLITVKIDYHGIPADGLIISRNKFGKPSFFGDNWPDRARHWLPTVDHPSDKALVDFYVTAPENLGVVATGIRKETRSLGNGTTLTRYASTVPLPTKVMVIGVSDFAVETAGLADGVPVETWVYTDNYAEGFIDYAQAVGITSYFNRRIGRFAFEKLANVQSKTVYGGMENSGAIFYYENSVTGKNQIQSLLAHEIAHQWFGDAVTEADWHHIWLSEGFATYLEGVCMDEHFDAEPLATHMQAMRDRVTRYYQRNPAPVIDTTVTQLTKLLNTNSYQKGAWVLHMLRQELGEEHFWQGLQQYYQRYTNRNALTDDFRRVMEEVSGRNLSIFFNQWLEQGGHPVLEITYLQTGQGNEMEFHVRQTQPGQLFDFALTLRISGLKPDQVYETTIRVSQASQSFLIHPDFIPQTISYDPYVNLLFEWQNKN